MPDYFDSALFVYTDESASFLETIQNNSLGVKVTTVSYEILKQDVTTLQSADHVVISGDIAFLKIMFHYAMAYNFSIGIIPLPHQKNIRRSFMLPNDKAGLVDLALRKDSRAIDLILGNNKIIFFKATIGRVPLIDNPEETNRLQILKDGIKLISSLKLLPFSISADDEPKTVIETAAAGCMIVQHHKRSLASKLIAHDSSLTDGLISLFVVAPFSIIDYVRFLFNTLYRSEKHSSIPRSTGYIKRSTFSIDSESKLQVAIDEDRVTGQAADVDAQVVHAVHPAAGLAWRSASISTKAPSRVRS